MISLSKGEQIIRWPVHAASCEAPAPECVMTGALQRVKCRDYLRAIFGGNDPCRDAET